MKDMKYKLVPQQALETQIGRVEDAERAHEEGDKSPLPPGVGVDGMGSFGADPILIAKISAPSLDFGAEKVGAYAVLDSQGFLKYFRSIARAESYAASGIDRGAIEF
jgi:hypothetical protein